MTGAFDYWACDFAVTTLRCWTLAEADSGVVKQVSRYSLRILRALGPSVEDDRTRPIVGGWQLVVVAAWLANGRLQPLA